MYGVLGGLFWVYGCLNAVPQSDWPYRPLNLLLFVLACGLGGALIGDWLDHRPHEPRKRS